MIDDTKYTELKHDCELQLDDDILYTYIKSGPCVNFRRRWRKLCVISEFHPLSKLYFKSQFAIRLENQKHLKDNFYTIHPLSTLKIMIIIYVLTYIQAPFYIMVPVAEMNYLRFGMDAICIIDFLFALNTGYIIKSSNKIIMSRKKIFRHKFLASLFLDFFSSLSILSYFIAGDVGMYLQYLVILKYFRFLTLLRYLEQYFEDTRWSFKVVTIFKLVLLAIIINLWCSIGIYFSTIHSKQEKTALSEADTYFILICCQDALFLLLLFGSKRELDFNFAITEMIVVTTGLVFQLVIISQLVQIVKFRGSQNAFYKLSQQLEEFMRFKNLPNGIRKRLLTYFNVRYQEEYYREVAILEMISPQLHQEMLLHTHMYLLEKSSIFHDLPTQLMSAIIQYLKPEIYLPSDIIVVAGSLGDCMYFIGTGTVAVYTPAGKELCHLSDGASFGELSMVMENEHRIANVVAIDNCEIFTLNRKDFTREIECYPESYERIRLLVQDKVRRTLIGSLDGDVSSEQISDDRTLRTNPGSAEYIRV